MKAILKADRKVILDLDPCYGTKVSHGKDGSIKFETPAYVTKASASSVEWDFTGVDAYVFKCPKCGRSHFVSPFSL